MMRSLAFALSLAALGGFLAPALAEELLVNGNLDSGSLAPWTTFAIPNGGAPQIGPPSVGTGAADVHAPSPSTTSGTYKLRTSYGGNIAGGNYGAYQQVTVMPGHLHVLQGDVAGGLGGVSTFNGSAHWEVRILDGPWNPAQVNGGTIAYQKTAPSSIPGSGWGFNWEHFNKGFTPNSSTITVFVKYDALDNTWAYNYFGASFDTLSLVDATTTCMNPSNIDPPSPPIVFSVPPDPGSPDITFTGSNLDQITLISLQHESGAPVLSGTIKAQSPTSVTATFTIPSSPLGYYTVTGTRSAPCPNASLSQAVQVACAAPPTTLETVGIPGLYSDRAMSGNSSFTTALTGINLSSLTAVKLVKSRDNDGADRGSAASPIDGTGLTMAGDNLLVTFDLTGAEAGRYDMVCTHPCGQVNNNIFQKAFLVYLPTLDDGNPGFEDGYKADLTTGSPCAKGCNTTPDDCWMPEGDANNPGHANRPKPKHWDLGQTASGAASIQRDGNVFHPGCSGGAIQNITGDHYGTVVGMWSDAPRTMSMFLTIAAPNVDGTGKSTADFNVRIEASVLGGNGTGSGGIVLRDGCETDTVITATPIPHNPAGNDGLITSRTFNAVVPAGTQYASTPTLLTIELKYDAVPGSGSGQDIHALQVDNVRTGAYVPPGCNPDNWADADGDGDVDMDDFAVFQLCYTGSDTGLPSVPGYPCTCFDRDLNNTIDVSDFNAFVACQSGPGVPAPVCNP